MNLSGHRNDSTKSLIPQTSVSTTSLSLSTNDNLPISYASETDPVFSAWDKSTGILINRSQVIDDLADIVPLGLALTSQGITIATDGTQFAYVLLNWTAISSTTFDYYIVRYKRSSLSVYIELAASSNSIYIPSLVPGTSYDFSVASVNKSGAMSAFCTKLTVTTYLDTTLPATVTGLTASADIQAVLLNWTANVELDLDSYDIYRNTTNSSATASLIANTSSTYFYNGGLTGAQIYYYWIKAKDTSGNISAAFSTVASATPRNVTTNDILDAAITANKTSIAAINPVDGEINANKVGTLQIDTDAVQGYHILDATITAAKTSIAAINPVSGEINANKIGTLQIQDDAVTGVQILNNAIDANHIITGAILPGHLSIGSVTANAIAVDAVTANAILAGAVTARKITSYNFVVDGPSDAFTSNDPTAGEVSWYDCEVIYDGITYTITDGHCPSTDKYIYWVNAATAFSTSVSLPSLGNDDFLVATNNSGTCILVWNSTIINGNRITTGSVTASNIATGTITTNEIAASTIVASNIAAGSITGNKLQMFNFLVTEGAFTNNSPDANKVSWANIKVVYNGTEHTITDGNCATTDVYIYWELSSPTVFTCSPTFPNLTNSGFLVATNGNSYFGKGTVVLAWNSTTVDGNRITTGSIVASNIAAGTITANEIAAGTITSNEIMAGTILASNIKAGEITTTQLNFTPATASNIIATINASSETGLTIAAEKITISGDTTFSAGYDPTAKNRTFYQTTEPTSPTLLTEGDLWVDTDDGNKLYRYSGAAWVNVQDSAITTVANTAATAIANAATAQGTADGKVTTYYQDGVPTGDTGDLWMDTNDGNKLYRAASDGSDEIKAGEWVEVQDTAIQTAIANAATAQNTADGKIVSFFQNAVPTSTDIGDLWIDTDDDNKLYVAACIGANEIKAGEWVSARDIGITDTIAALSAIDDDKVLSKTEKPRVVSDYNTILLEQTAINAQATALEAALPVGQYDDTLEVAYNATVTSLTAYLTGLSPVYTDYDQDTAIPDVGGITFMSRFADVYEARQLLSSYLTEESGNLLETKIEAGWITTGTVQVGTDAAINAGITGNGSSGSSIRFWAGDTYANRGIAPFKVDDDGNMAATSGAIGNWTIDGDYIYTGTKHTTDGPTTNAGDITLNGSDGSLHAKNFYIDGDGEVWFNAVSPVLDGVTTKVFDIGDWNMDSTANVYIIHGLGNVNIRGVDIVIRTDDTTYSAQYNLLYAGFWWLSNNGSDDVVALERNVSGFFDSNAFDATSFNRGWVTIRYEA